MSQSKYKFDTQIINGIATRIHTVVVHTFDVREEDAVLFAAEPLYKWQQSEQGKWVMAHALEQPVWQSQLDYQVFTTRFVIIAKLQGRDYTFWTMKWNSK